MLYDPETRLPLIFKGNPESPDDCEGCDGSGIMVLEPGPIRAPCLVCSFEWSLDELEDNIFLQEERQKIAIHNARVANLPGWE